MIRAARPYLAFLAVLAGLLFYAGHPIVASAALLAALAIGLFFRDPERIVPPGDHLVVSPADGRVVEVIQPAGGEQGKISIFLSLFNVHVNRSPVGGRVKTVTYKNGTFRPAYEDAAGLKNERNTLDVEGPGGVFAVSQIAGVVARRIRCFKKAGDEVARGERIGYIAFGSRTELTLPPGASVRVAVGDKVRGAETVVASLTGSAGEEHG